ncbi:hypothetical protein FHS27_006387 [Rhodopirellula rubra]|uniref:Uncharacterized protein n=1 Tax=Aporhodopirellula rubra TaxID=980271 RepID=A0A7W5E5I8_9BACT|nr:hypothetical protein [Aporhodopirellula rubra]MBB3210540.1 hypothetical protein [Aporhodopirellula rubra]
MPELRRIVPRPAIVAKERRCAAGHSVKTMLAGAELRLSFHRERLASDVQSAAASVEIQAVVLAFCVSDIGRPAGIADNARAIIRFAVKVIVGIVRPLKASDIAKDDMNGLFTPIEEREGEVAASVRERRMVCISGGESEVDGFSGRHWKDLRRPTEGFYDTALNEANDA